MKQNVASKLQFETLRFVTTVVLFATATASLESAATSTPVSSAPAVQFVEQLYTGILKRAPDQAGVDFWVGELRAGRASCVGLTRKFMGTEATGIMRSFIRTRPTTVSTKMVYVSGILYGGVLNRAPDQAGLDFWSGYLAGGGSISKMENAFLTSNEFITRCARAGLNY